MNFAGDSIRGSTKQTRDCQVSTPTTMRTQMHQLEEEHAASLPPQLEARRRVVGEPSGDGGLMLGATAPDDHLRHSWRYGAAARLR